MNKKVLGLLAVTVVLAGASLLATKSASADSQCLPIHGRLNSDITTDGCNSPVGLCTTGVTIGTGLLDGDTHYVFDGAAWGAGMPDLVEGTTMSYTGHLTITTADGSTATFRDVGLGDWARGTFSSIATLESGTGRFAGATGTLFTRGFFSAHVTTQLDGEFCLSGGD